MIYHFKGRKVTYISILRGINVSGQKKIKMADLRTLYQENGFENVSTYIQSGNVVFDSSEVDRSKLRSFIENVIEDHYEFHVPVDLRTNLEIKAVIENCPYEEAVNEDNATKILVTFLRSIPSEENIMALSQYVNPPEKLIVQGAQVYLYCPNGYGRSKLNNTFLERKLGVSATTRNWRSVKKIYELSVQ